MMVLRRHKGVLQTVFVLLVVGAVVRYSYKYYKDSSMKLKAANIRHHELLEERNSISRQLESMTQSKSNLEYALKSKALEFSKFKKECQAEKDKLENEQNRAKSESLTKFNALDSEYRMLKAKHEDLDIEHKHVKRNFERLKDDHSKIESNYKTNLAELKAKDEKIISALEKQVEHLQNREHSLQTKVDELKEILAKYQRQIRELIEKKLKDEGTSKNENSRETDEGPGLNQKKPLKKSLRLKGKRRNDGRRGEGVKRKREAVEDNDGLNHFHQQRQRKSSHVSMTPVLGSIFSTKELTRVYKSDLASETEQGLNKKKVISPDAKKVVIVPGVDKETADNEEKKISERESEQKEEGIEESYKIQEEPIEKIKLNENSEEVKEEQLNDNAKEQKQKEMKEGKDIEFRQNADVDDEKKEGLLEDVEEKKKLDLNNDQKFDDQGAALLEDENEDNAAEGQDNNDIMDRENVAHKNKEEVA